MRRISGHYTDKNNKPVNYDLEVAGSWEELSTGQMATILEVLSYSRADKYTTMASLITLLFDKHWHVPANLPDEELHELMTLTNFILETKPPAFNRYRHLVLKKVKCLPPNDDLGNLGFGEFCFAYQAWYTYLKHKEPAFLDKLIAVLYRPADPGQVKNDPNYSGDERERFNENLISEREKQVKKLATNIKQAIFAWFTAALRELMEQRPHVFPIDESTGEDIEREAEASDRTWFDVFRELLGPKWGHIPDLKYTNAIFVLDGMEETFREDRSKATPTE